MEKENKNPLVVEMVDNEGTKVKVEVVSHFHDNGKTYVIANDLGNETDSYILELVSLFPDKSFKDFLHDWQIILDSSIYWVALKSFIYSPGIEWLLLQLVI